MKKNKIVGLSNKKSNLVDVFFLLSFTAAMIASPLLIYFHITNMNTKVKHADTEIQSWFFHK